MSQKYHNYFKKGIQSPPLHPTHYAYFGSIYPNDVSRIFNNHEIEFKALRSFGSRFKPELWSCVLSI